MKESVKSVNEKVVKKKSVKNAVVKKAVVKKEAVKKKAVKKKAVKKKVVKKKGFKDFIGKRITVFCCRYIYTGILVSVDKKCLYFSDNGIVYETGAFDNTKWSDMQKLPNDWHVQIDSIESWGILK